MIGDIINYRPYLRFYYLISIIDIIIKNAIAPKVVSTKVSYSDIPYR
jgi:hypothetical protein